MKIICYIIKLIKNLKLKILIYLKCGKRRLKKKHLKIDCKKKKQRGKEKVAGVCVAKGGGLGKEE